MKQLQLNNHQYELTVLNIWLVWCNKYSSTHIELQRLMTSQPLFNWWQTQYKKLEKEFSEDAELYTDITQLDALTVYMRSVNKIHWIYSKSLINKALKNDNTTKN